MDRTDFRVVTMTVNHKPKGELGHVVKTLVCRKRDSKSLYCYRVAMP